MAATMGGSIGLDAECYCRRCDSRTDLVKRVVELLEICESINSRDDVEKVLNVCFCVLRNSQKGRVKELLNHIELAAIKELMMERPHWTRSTKALWTYHQFSIYLSIIRMNHRNLGMKFIMFFKH